MMAEDLVEKLKKISAQLEELTEQNKTDTDEYRKLAEEFRLIAERSLASGQLRDKKDYPDA